MKILVVSDSHKKIKYISEAIYAYTPDILIHLGDLVADVDDIRMLFPKLPVENVKGNCDGFSPEQEIRVIELGGKRIYLTHGHRHGVKMGIKKAILAAEAAKADLLLFGHTHRALLEEHEDVTVMNPGSVSGMGEISCGIIEISNGEMSCCIKKYINNDWE